MPMVTFCATTHPAVNHPAVNIFFSAAKKFQSLLFSWLVQHDSDAVSIAPVLVELSYFGVVVLLDAPD
jgi:hypothetical protein